MVESLTRQVVTMTVLAVSLGLLAEPVASQSAEVSRAQTAMVTIRIGKLPETHTVPLIAYEALIRQGVETTLVTGPARAPQTGQTMYMATPAPSGPAGSEPLTMTGWAVGVFR